MFAVFLLGLLAGCVFGDNGDLASPLLQIARCPATSGCGEVSWRMCLVASSDHIRHIAHAAFRVFLFAVSHLGLGVAFVNSIPLLGRQSAAM